MNVPPREVLRMSRSKERYYERHDKQPDGPRCSELRDFASDGGLYRAFVHSAVTNAASGAPDDEVRATFERFVAAQNAHDVKAVESLLLNSPAFSLDHAGDAGVGIGPRLKRFAALYEGTWRLDPEASSLKTTMLGSGAAQLYVPIIFTIGAAGQPSQPARFSTNLILVKTPGGWKVVEHLADTRARPIAWWRHPRSPTGRNASERARRQ